ncbi:MAG: pseudouridine synthase [Nanoarchaeota archaeon]|nr:pseudouridine synthase [Nanoarchaeota archaeon]
MEEKQRVQKIMQLSGEYSRRKAEELIAQGKVQVNGQQISLGSQCTINDQIKVNNQILNIHSQEKTYILMNKKIGYVCSNNDPHNKETVFDLLKSQDKVSGLFTVGRLDKDTSGLLILTNDGDFANKIIHPSSKIQKEYLATLNKPLDQTHKRQLEKGIMLDDYKLSPCSIKQIGKTYQIKINAGKKRQIRRMFETFNYRVETLGRTRIGKLSMQKTGMKPGKYKKLPKEFLEKKIFEK